MPSEEILDTDGNISVTNFYNNEMHRLVKITYRYSYKLPVSRFGTNENVIEKNVNFLFSMDLIPLRAFNRALFYFQPPAVFRLFG